MERLDYLTPKEGVGRSNRLGDANNNRHLQIYFCKCLFGLVDRVTPGVTSVVFATLEKHADSL